MLTLYACSLPQQQKKQQQQYVSLYCFKAYMYSINDFFFSCLKWMELCIGVLSTILRYHLNTAVSCAPVMFTAIGNILFTSYCLNYLTDNSLEILYSYNSFPTCCFFL